jgi:hypothetical protein
MVASLSGRLFSQVCLPLPSERFSRRGKKNSVNLCYRDDHCCGLGEGSAPKFTWVIWDGVLGVAGFILDIA